MFSHANIMHLQKWSDFGGEDEARTMSRINNFIYFSI